MPRLCYSIVVDDAHLGKTETIAREIRQQGFTVDRIIPEAGAIQATGSASDIELIRGIEGVLRVRQQGDYHLPPMNGSIPQ